MKIFIATLVLLGSLVGMTQTAGAEPPQPYSGPASTRPKPTATPAFCCPGAQNIVGIQAPPLPTPAPIVRAAAPAPVAPAAAPQPTSRGPATQTQSQTTTVVNEAAPAERRVYVSGYGSMPESQYWAMVNAARPAAAVVEEGAYPAPEAFGNMIRPPSTGDAGLR